MPIDQKINYFVLLELGNNGITKPDNSFAKATDASITFNHLNQFCLSVLQLIVETPERTTDRT